MNGCRAKYSSLAAALAAMASLTGGAGVAEPTPQRTTSPVTGAIGEAEKSAVRPTFASIPPMPTDVRPFQAWRAAIADTRTVGAKAAAEGQAGPWTLSDSERWAGQSRAEAVPPAPMTKPADGDTDAFVREMLRRATPPPRAH